MLKIIHIYSSSDLLPDAVPAIFKDNDAELNGVRSTSYCPNPFKGFKKYLQGLFHALCFQYHYFLTQRLIMRFMRKYAHTVMVSNEMDRAFR